MGFNKNTFFQFILFAVILLSTAIVIIDHRQEVVNVSTPEVVDIDNLSEIKERGSLRVVVGYNSTDYFVYKGQPMGFQYEILRQLSEDLDLKLDIIVEDNLTKSFDLILKGKADILAHNLAVTGSRKHNAYYTPPLYQTRQVLVQRSTYKDSIIRNQINLGGKDIYVRSGSAYVKRLENLSDEIGDRINIVQDSIFGSEKLVEMVSTGEIDYSVCDENIAKLNGSYYKNIDIYTPISFSQNIAWALLPQGVTFNKFIDKWISTFVKSSNYKAIYRKYFISHRFKGFKRNRYHSRHGGQISEFDDIVKRVCSESSWDWRLILSLIYQESRFDPYAESWVGAEGLMQLMPTTAAQLGVEDVNDPEQNILGGVKYLNSLDEIFKEKVPDPEERVKFVLAAYNVGVGHIIDGRKLAKKYGKSPMIWDDNVATYIKNKSMKKFYADPIVKWGYCRGQETFDFVRDIEERYRAYCNNFEK